MSILNFRGSDRLVESFLESNNRKWLLMSEDAAMYVNFVKDSVASAAVSGRY